MFKNTFLFLFLFLTISVSSQEWNQNVEQTKVTFKIKNSGINVDGKFNKVKISTNFNSNKLSKSYISAEIIVKSISTGIDSRDEHILEEDYFDEPKHKTITLKSTNFKKNPEGNLLMFADLTIKGITKKIKVPLEVSFVDNSAKIFSTFSINRKDFNVGGGSFIMSKIVKIQVEYRGTK